MLCVAGRNVKRHPIFSWCWSCSTGLLTGNSPRKDDFKTHQCSFSLSLSLSLVCVPRTRPMLFSLYEKQSGSCVLEKQCKNLSKDAIVIWRSILKSEDTVFKQPWKLLSTFNNHDSLWRTSVNVTPFPHEAKVITWVLRHCFHFTNSHSSH